MTYKWTQCELCGSEMKGTKISDTRQSAGAIRRRRECGKCGQRVTTYEISAQTFDGIRKREQALRDLVEIYRTLGLPLLPEAK